MSTPLVDIPLPYGVTVESEQGDRMMKTIGNDPRVGNISLGLTAGPCRVAASYRGPEEAVLQLVNGNSVTQLATIPAGGGSRSVMVAVGARLGDRVRLYLSSPPAGGITGTLEVYPVPS